MSRPTKCRVSRRPAPGWPSLSLPLLLALLVALAGGGVLRADDAAPVEAPAPPTWEEVIPTRALRPGTSVTTRLERYLPLSPAAKASGALEGFLVTSEGAHVTVALPADATLGDGYYFVPVTVADGDLERAIVLPFRVSTQKPTTFTYKATAGKSVFVAGSFNGWNSAAWRLAWSEEKGLYEGSFEVPSGEHTYKFVVDGEWMADPGNPRRDTTGYGNSVLDAGGAAAPMPQLYFVQEKGIDLRTFPAATIVSGRLIAGGAPLTAGADLALTVLDGNAPLDAELDAATGEVRFKVRERDNDVRRLRLFVSGRRPSEEGALAPFRQEFAMVLRGLDGSADWHDAVIYFVMTDRFADGDAANNAPVEDEAVRPLANYHGGDFQGIVEKLRVEGYFEQLGVDTLWISPVFTNPAGAFKDAIPPYDSFTGYHGYWPVHPREIDPRFGGADGLRDLVEAVHGQRKRLLVDFVSNHVHQEHPWFQEHPEWFGTLDLPDGRKNIRLFDEYPLTTWFDTFLPSFDFPASPEAVEASVAQALYLLEEFGIDGFRHDAVKHVPTSYWERLTEEVRARFELPRGRRVYQVGETISGRGLIMDYVGPEMMDAQFDFPLLWTIRDVFAFERAGFEDLHRSLLDSLRDYGEDHLMVSFVGNHDFSRFAAFAEGDVTNPEEEKKIGRENDVQVDDPDTYKKLELGLVFVFTIPGIPMIYYGDEIGLTGAGDPDNRRPMKFGDTLSPAEMTMLLRARMIGRLRRDLPALWTGSYLPLSVGKDTFAYLRSSVDGRVVVLLNRGDAVWEPSLTLPGADAPVRLQAVYASNPPRPLGEGDDAAMSFPVFVEASAAAPATFRVEPMSAVVYAAAPHDPLRTWDGAEAATPADAAPTAAPEKE